MGRITRPPPKAKRPWFEVSVSIWTVRKPWFASVLARAAGTIGYRQRSRGWSCTVFSFPTPEQAAELEAWLRRHADAEWRLERSTRPCPIRLQYEQAARAQHAVIWGLSTGLIRDIVRVYRRERSDCSAHGSANWAAADVILATAPSIDRDRAREMVDQMLAWVIARHAAWFWRGLQGSQHIAVGRYY